ncbi:MAG: amino acid adenylation domain-containing protein [Pseudomonadota bacterium]
MLDGPRDYPLTQSQLRFWRGAQMAPNVASYTMVWRFDLMIAVDPSRFARALETVVSKTDALRLAFHEIDGEPRQFLQNTPFALPPVLDLSQEADPEAALEAFQAQWIPEPFDLSQTTYRARLARLSAEHWVWLSAQHHIACDAQSGALLFEAVSAAYSGQSGDESRSYLAAAERLDRAQHEAPTPNFPKTKGHGIPYGIPQPSLCRSQRVEVPISAAALDRFEALASDPDYALFTPDLTRFALYATAYGAYLARVSGDEAVTIGLPSHNRLDGAAKETQGLFVEVLPFAFTVEASDSFADVFAKVRAGLGDFLRQARPNAIASVRSAAASGVLNFIQARFGDFAGAPARVAWLHSGAHDPQHPIRLHATSFDGGALRLALDVNDETCAEVPAAEVATHLATFLEGVSSAPTRAVNELPLGGTHSKQIGPTEPAEAHAGVLPLIAAQVAKAPDAVALKEGAVTLSYEALWAKSGSVAATIAEAGLAEGPIAIHLNRSIAAMVAILATLRAGRAFVPIAANTPPARAAEIIRLAEAVAAFGDAGTEPTLTAAGVALLSTEVQTAGAPEAALSDTAYVLFTSGSTGTPKGVEVSHEGLSRYISWAAAAFGGEGPGDYALFSSLSFDLTITSIFAPLVSGGTVHIYPETGAQDLAVLDVFADDAARVVKLTPSHLALICESARPVSTIRTLVLGGENLPTALCRQALAVLGPQVEIVNEYGPTEAVVGAMIHRFDAAHDHGSSVSIGVPADGVEITVRDAALNLMPVGVQGEICIAGRLAEGYLNRADLTAERFVSCPETGARIYRTGDIGRLGRDGRLSYLGRADSQLKIGGVRIETAEIDRALRTVPGVHAVHVLQGQPPRAGQSCTACGISDSVPAVKFTDAGLCTTCADFESLKDRTRAYFRPEPELSAKVDEARTKARGDYDAIMLLSGGKDSSYAAYRLGALTDRVLAVTLDNGFIADGAKENIDRVVADLGWDHRYLTTSKMNEIFVDSLKRHSNVCQGCFKAVYTLAIRTARAEGVPMIVTGLSRGQFFETRLTPELFSQSVPTCAELEHMVTEARRRYHGEDDAVARLLETGDLADGRFLEEVEIVDIYRYIDVPVSEIYTFLNARGAWRRPSDTGRSTNCLINDAGIHVHKTREGFHNYALPYSWDVRMGHKTRHEALEELDDDIDTAEVTRILDEIGYDGPMAPKEASLTAYVAADAGVTQDALFDAVRAHLPAEVRPSQIMRVDQMPLTPNGKVDPTRLPRPLSAAVEMDADGEPPKTKMELRLAAILQEVLPGAAIARDTDFFDLGLDSLAAIQVAMRAVEAQIPLPATALFDHRSLRALALFAEAEPAQPAQEEASQSEEDALDLGFDDDDFAAIADALS